jgi:hypothetical protein
MELPVIAAEPAIIEEQQDERVQHNWFNISLSDFDFKNDDFFNSDGFEFDENFQGQDAGQLQSQPTVLESTELLQNLRTTEERHLYGVHEYIFDFYDQSKKHCTTEFMGLLRAYISNNDIANRLSENCRSEELVKFYRLELSGKINFGNHEICSHAAAEIEEEFKTDLKELGLKFQQKTQVARLQTASKLLERLKSCSGKFYNHGKQSWENMCKNILLHNIFDQQFVVKFTHPKRPDEDTNVGDEHVCEESDEGFEFGNEETTSSSVDHFSIFKLSTYVFGMAIHDSRLEVDALILRRRKEITEAKLKAAALKAKQTTVDIRADSMKQVDIAATIGQQLDEVNARIDYVQNVQTTHMQRSSDRIDLTSSTRPNKVKDLKRNILQMNKTIGSPQVTTTR